MVYHLFSLLGYLGTFQDILYPEMSWDFPGYFGTLGYHDCNVISIYPEMSSVSQDISEERDGNTFGVN